MELEASMGGTLRTILILLIIWFVLRLLLRAGKKRGRPAGTRWTNDTGRPKGEVRIEKLKDDERDQGPRPGGNVSDADFEELK